MTLLDIFTIIASTAAVLLAIVGSCCAFMKWMLESFESDLIVIEEKIQTLEKNVQIIVEDLKDQRKRTDQLYEILINLVKKK